MRGVVTQKKGSVLDLAHGLLAMSLRERSHGEAWARRQEVGGCWWVRQIAMPSAGRWCQVPGTLDSQADEEAPLA